MASNPKAIIWFRQDLRLRDNPALTYAASVGEVLPIYILDEKNNSNFPLGRASRWWLNHSLRSLDKSLNGALCTFRGDPIKILKELVSTYQIENVFWNRSYEPWQVERDTAIKRKLQIMGIKVESFNGSMLHEPWEVLKPNGHPYKVFTPFYKQHRIKTIPQTDTVNRGHLRFFIPNQHNTDLKSLNLIVENDWSKNMMSEWTPGEEGGKKALKLFLSQGLYQYKLGRDFPERNAVSKLSPHLHFGELSPIRAWNEVNNYATSENLETQAEHFYRELVWREFSCSLLYYFPELTVKNINKRFNAFPWQKSSELLSRWQDGETGYPLIDAGMRQLSRTGYMHNRVRMITASFLVKNLLIDWRIGAEWFWDSLVDADLANNYCSWQWVAGSGVDAAPYFRIFNPVTQSKKFDSEAKYIKNWVPELVPCPNKYIHDPSSAPSKDLQQQGIKLDKDYPSAIVELKTTREAALNAYKSLKAVSQ